MLLEAAVAKLTERVDDAVMTIQVNESASGSGPKQPQPVVMADTRACTGRHECHCGHVDDIGVEVINTKERVANVERQIQALEQMGAWHQTNQAPVSAAPAPQGPTSQPRPMPQPRVDDAWQQYLDQRAGAVPLASPIAQPSPSANAAPQMSPSPWPGACAGAWDAGPPQGASRPV